MTHVSRLTGIAVAAVLALGAGSTGAKRLSHWGFNSDPAGKNSVEGGPEARVEGARLAEGREGRALAFEDWSVLDWLKPDPARATRVVIPDTGDARLNPTGSFRISAWIHPTADPVYYGGIVEKGRGFGASYRLVLLRGLRVSGSAGDRHVTVRSTAPVSLGEWHEVSLVVDPTNLTLYVDGKESARAAIPAGTKLTSSDPLIIGDRFTGRIDEVAIQAE